MAVANFFKITLLLAIPAVIALIATLIYLPVYKKKINARLDNFAQSDIKELKPVTPPIKVYLISFGVALLAGIILIAILITLYKTNTSANRVSLGQVEETYCWIRRADELPSLLDGYDPGDELPGYFKTSSKSENGFELYFYAGRDCEVGGFPDGLIGVKYTGNEESFCLDVHSVQEKAVYPDSKADFTAQFITKGTCWLTVDTFNFFGKMDIEAVSSKLPQEQEGVVPSFEELKELRTGETAKMHLELDKEFGIEDWYLKEDK